MYGKKTTEDFFYPKWELLGLSVARDAITYFTTKCHYPDLVSASDWLKTNYQHGTTNQKHNPDLVVTKHQYGISGFVPQALFCGETTAVVFGAKCLLSFQARFSGNSNNQ